MSKNFDVIIVGLGAMGSSAAYELAQRGVRVLGLDQFRPPHDLGSSHGRTRIIREAYFEDPAYVPLVQRAYELWDNLEKEANRVLLRKTGGLMIGRPDGVLVSGAERSAREHRLAHELLTADELRRKFPAFEPAPEMVGVWEPRAGVLSPELAIESYLELAATRGAELRFDEPVVHWECGATGVRVVTGEGEYHADRMVLTAGAWIGELVADLVLPTVVERQVLYWFRPKSATSVFDPEQCPISILEYAPGKFFYTFPDLGDGVKVALHHQGEVTTPATIRREVSESEMAHMRSLLREFMPAAAGALGATATCLYTNTPDEHFLLDWHPVHSSVLIGSPCSGHGFKFASVVGEILAQKVLGKPVTFDLSLFGLSRLHGARWNPH